MNAARTWTHPNDGDKPSLIRLTSDALYLAVIPVAELREDLPLDSYAPKRIPLTAITQAQAEENDPAITVTHQQGDSAAETTVIALADVVQRDEVLDALLKALGTTWEKVIEAQGRLRAALWPVAGTTVAGLATSIAYHEALQIAAGARFKPKGPGRWRLLRHAMHWIEAQFGPTGILIGGGIVVVLCLIWLCYRVANPVVFIRLRPVKSG